MVYWRLPEVNTARLEKLFMGEFPFYPHTRRIVSGWRNGVRPRFFARAAGQTTSASRKWRRKQITQREEQRPRSWRPRRNRLRRGGTRMGIWLRIAYARNSIAEKPLGESGNLAGIRSTTGCKALKSA